MSPLLPYTGYTGWLQVKPQVRAEFFQQSLIFKSYTPCQLQVRNSYLELERVANSKFYYVTVSLLPYTHYTGWVQGQLQV